jgi:BTB/POZ domain-containing protein 3/6
MALNVAFQFQYTYMHSLIPTVYFGLALFLTTVCVESCIFYCFAFFTRYIYCENALLDLENVMDVRYAANKYVVPKLEDICSKYLKDHLSARTVCTVSEHASMCDDASLQASCLQFICSNAAAVLHQSGIQELRFTNVEKMLKADDLDCVPESVLFDAMLTWADSECGRRELEATDENRRTVLGRLLYLIRFQIMDPKYFANTVARLHVLSPEEKDELFLQRHLGDDKSLCTRFITRNRCLISLYALSDDKKRM